MVTERRDPKAFVSQIKEKFPIYKDIPDSDLIRKVVEKFPQYKDVQERAFGVITSGEPRDLKRTALEFVKEQKNTFTDLLSEGIESIKGGIEQGMVEFGRGAVGFAKEAVAQDLITPISPRQSTQPTVAERGAEAIATPILLPFRAVAAGVPLNLAVKLPEFVPSFAATYNNKLKNILPNDKDRELISNIGGMLTEVGIMTVVLAGAGRGVRGTRSKFAKAQGRAFAPLKAQIKKEATLAGLKVEEASAVADEIVARQFSKVGVLRKTPGAINQATKVLKEHEGKVASLMKDHIANAKAARKARPTKEAAKPRLTLPSETIPLIVENGPVAGKYYEMGDGQLVQIIRGKMTPVPPEIAEAALKQARTTVPAEGRQESASSIVEVAPEPRVVKRKVEASVRKEEKKKLTVRKEGRSLFHETGSEGARGIVGVIVDASGLNVSTSKELALGQKGKGIVIEFDEDILLGKKGKIGTGTLRPIKKPGTPIVGQEEFSLIGGRITPKAIKSFTIKLGTVLNPVFKRFLKATKEDYNIETLTDGSIKYTNVDFKPIVNRRALIAERVKVQKRNLKQLESEELVAANDRALMGAEEAYLDALALDEPAAIEATQAQLEALQEEVSRRANFDLDEAGFFDTGILTDAYNALSGVGEEVAHKYFSLTKKLGTPFFIAEKFPEGKPIYQAVQNGIDNQTAMFWEFMHELQPQDLRKLSKSSGAKITEALRIGNTPTVNRYFSDQELVQQFKFSEAEIAGYKKIAALYQRGLQVEIQNRKTYLDFKTMTPKQQSAAERSIEGSVSTRKGYVSQQRLAGKWAVFQEAIEGEQPFYNTYENKALAVRASKALKAEGGVEPRVYLSTKADNNIRKHLTLADLENLIEAAGVDSNAAESKALRAELQKRGFGAHFLKRKNDPGYDWTWDNVLESAIDYADGVTTKFAKTISTRKANEAYRKGVDKMSPIMKSYWRDYIDNVHDKGAEGYRGIQKFLYAWNLSFNTKFLAVNLGQPLQMTYPEMAKYWDGFQVEKEFLSSYATAFNFIKHKFFKGKQGKDLTPELTNTLNKLEIQGALGNQMRVYMLGSRRAELSNLDDTLSLFARASEYINRSHAAVAAFNIATNKLKLSGAPRFEFIKNFLGVTNLLYGKQNIPSLITGAGNLRRILRTAYVFRSFPTGYIQFLARQMRSGKPGVMARTIGAGFTLAGMKWIPGVTLGYLVYQYLTGRAAEGDIRASLDSIGVKGKAQDAVLGGAFNFAGIDAGSSFGVGDIYNIYGSIGENILGAPLGQVNKASRAFAFAQQGENGRAMEEMSPTAIRNMLRAARESKSGVVNFAGEKITTQTGWDTAITAVGFTPSSRSRAFQQRTAEATITSTSARNKAQATRQIAQALYKDKNPSKAAFLRRNARRRGIRIDEDQLRAWRDRFSGRKKRTRPPREIRKDIRRIREVFNR